MIVFHNPGEIDKRSIITFGINAKIGDNPIGKFGTGLKIAIAILLRTGHQIEIWAGMERLVFETRTEHIRDKEFQRVYMNGNPLGFTTLMGQTWELWQAFRELYANARDEGGDCFDMHPNLGSFEFGPNKTVILVTGNEFGKLFDTKSEFVLEGTPLFVIPGVVEVYAGKNNGVFYRGFKVNRWDKESNYTYNILGHLDLTEDRTAKYDFQVEDYIKQAVLKAPGPEFVRHVLTADKKSVEGSIRSYGSSSYYGHHTPSHVFLDTVAEVKKEGIEVSDEIDEVYQESRPEDSMQFVPMEEEELQDFYKEALEVLEKLDFKVKYPIAFVVDLRDAKYVKLVKGKIYVTQASINDIKPRELARLIFVECCNTDGQDIEKYLWDKLMELV
jgi:hypothetical protein